MPAFDPEETLAASLADDRIAAGCGHSSLAVDRHVPANFSRSLLHLFYLKTEAILAASHDHQQHKSEVGRKARDTSLGGIAITA